MLLPLIRSSVPPRIASISTRNFCCCTSKTLSTNRSGNNNNGSRLITDRKGLSSSHIQLQVRNLSWSSLNPISWFSASSTDVKKSTEFLDSSPELLSDEAFTLIEQDIGFIPDIPVLPENADLLDTAGTLASLGIGHSWWPPAGWVQQCLEYMTQSGYSWCLSIAIVTMFIRIITAPVIIHGQKSAARFHNHSPKFQWLQHKLKKANQSGDGYRIAEASANFTDYMRDHNLNPAKRLIVMLPMTVVFMTFFTALRGMAKAPYPGMDTGGMLWFPDLTACDAIYGLPIISAASVGLIFWTGAETGFSSKDAGFVMKYGLGFGAPTMVLFFTWFQPCALAFYWCCSNSITLIFTFILRTKMAQDFFGIEEKKKFKDSEFPPKFHMKPRDIWKDRDYLMKEDLSPRRVIAKSKETREALASKLAAARKEQQRALSVRFCNCQPNVPMSTPQLGWVFDDNQICVGKKKMSRQPTLEDLRKKDYEAFQKAGKGPIPKSYPLSYNPKKRKVEI